jgi:uncharacterized protein YjgD (DUF1641 family)
MDTSTAGNDMSKEIKVLNEKIDFLTEQVTGITSRLKAFDELKEDLSLFTNDAFTEVVNFLADVDFHFRSEELLFLLKKLLRNIKNISKLMTQLESFTQLMEDVSPLAKEVFSDLVEKFEQLEKDGLFKSLGSMMTGMRRLHENFTPGEIEQMGENHVRLLKLSNRMITPGNLEKLEKITDEIEQLDFQRGEKASLFKILKKARSPGVLRGLDLLLDIAAIISNQNKSTNQGG